MADELQALLNRIVDEELSKTEGAKEEILSQAKVEAEAILRNARAEADGIISGARKEAQIIERKGEEALRQASRDVLLSLRGKLNERAHAVALDLVGSALSGGELAQILSRMMVSYLQSGASEDKIEILLNESDLAAVDAALSAALAADLRSRCDLVPVNGVSGGFKLVFSGDDVVYDFTDKSLAEVLSTRLGSRLAAIVSGE